MHSLTSLVACLFSKIGARARFFTKLEQLKKLWNMNRLVVLLSVPLNQLAFYIKKSWMLLYCVVFIVAHASLVGLSLSHISGNCRCQLKWYRSLTVQCLQHRTDPVPSTSVSAVWCRLQCHLHQHRQIRCHLPWHYWCMPHLQCEHHPGLEEARILNELSPRPKLQSSRPRTRKAESAVIQGAATWKVQQSDTS